MERGSEINAIPPQNRWLIESFASRAALLGFVYLSINVVYHLGYLSELGIEYGFFAIIQSLPILENFIIAIYAFTVWGIIVEMPESTYLQLFSFFKTKSWRDKKISYSRFLLTTLLVIVYIAMQIIYVTFKDGNGISRLFSSKQDFSLHFFLSMIIPSWSFLTWSGTIIFSFFVIILVFFSNNSYRKHRSSGVEQLLRESRNSMEFHISAVAPAGIIFGFCLAFLILPGYLGKLTASQTINQMRENGYQSVAYIELTEAESLCGIKLIPMNNVKVWEGINNYGLSVYHLGHLGDYEVFSISGSSSYTNQKDRICLVSSSAIVNLSFQN